MPSESSSKKQRPAPGSMYFPPPAPVAAVVTAPAAGLLSPTSATMTNTTSSPRGASPNSPYSAKESAATTTKALTPNKQLGELLRAIEPRYCFHPAVEELLLDMANEFVQDVVGFTSKLTKHRRSTMLEAKDLQFCLAKNYGISLAGVLASSSTAAATTATSALALATAMDATSSSASVLSPLGQDLLLHARPAKNSLHMHRIALKRKALQRTKGKLLKSSSNGGAKVSSADNVRKHVRKTGVDSK